MTFPDFCLCLFLSFCIIRMSFSWKKKKFTTTATRKKLKKKKKNENKLYMIKQTRFFYHYFLLFFLHQSQNSVKGSSVFFFFVDYAIQKLEDCKNSTHILQFSKLDTRSSQTHNVCIQGIYCQLSMCKRKKKKTKH